MRGISFLFSLFILPQVSSLFRVDSIQMHRLKYTGEKPILTVESVKEETMFAALVAQR